MTQIPKSILTQLHDARRVAILIHQNPDGDTTGSGFALFYALRQLGKQAMVYCSDAFSKQFSFCYGEFHAADGEQEFDPDFVVSVDVADPVLFGNKMQQQHAAWLARIDLNIDHHQTNKQFGRENLVAPTASTCEIMFALVEALGVTMTPLIATCLYTGMCTDTGCFQYANTTAETHRMVATLIDAGVNAGEINRLLFGTKSKARLHIEGELIASLQYYYGETVAVAVISQEMMQRSGIDPADLDGLSAIPRQVEGVEVGITLREREADPESKEFGGYKVSLRSHDRIDASKVCASLGGGGHRRAAGCTLMMPCQQAIDTLLLALKPYFD